MGKVKVFLALGANLGNKEETFRQAVKDLAEGGLSQIKLSSFYETAPVGCEENAPSFLNGALSGFWEGTAEELLDLAQKLEVAAGRPADHPHWHSRKLDIDIILFGEEILTTDRLTIPHPLAHTRSFVLEPLAEIGEDALFPTLQKKVGTLWNEWKAANKKGIGIP